MSNPTPDEILRAWDEALAGLGPGDGAFVTNMVNARLVGDALREAMSGSGTRRKYHSPVWNGGMTTH